MLLEIPKHSNSANLLLTITYEGPRFIFQQI